MATDTMSLLDELEQCFTRYAALSHGAPLVLALWSIATWQFETFDCFPYLAITSPTKRCGKTRVAELLELVCSKPQRTVGISPAALFRSIEDHKPTLIVDEAEAMRNRDERASALREILNAGYRKGQKVIRCAGKGNYTLLEFDTFSPKVLVLIGELPDTLADRCISISMKRRTGERLERFRFARARADTQSLRDKIAAWVEANREAVQDWYLENDAECLQDREAELWLPLFAVCAIIAPERLPELASTALQLAGIKNANEPGDFGIRLLDDIRQVFALQTGDRLPTNDLISKLKDIQESPWPSWSQGRGLNPRTLSQLLKPFGVKPRNLRMNEHVVKGYERGDFEDVWTCYLPAATSATGLSFQRESKDLTPATLQVGSDSESGETSNVNAPCSGVAAPTAGIGLPS